MVDKIEMSLDDIIKSNKSKRGGVARNNKGGVIRGQKKTTGRTTGGGGFRQQRQGGILKGRSRGGIQKPKFSRGDVNSAWKHDLFDGPKGRGVLKTAGGGSGGIGSSKLLVSNLDYGVSESDIHELFADFGPLKNASVHYDRSGRSLGTADVIFERRADAAKAMKQYNGVPLDGRPMNIQFATSELPAVNRNRVQPRTPQRGPARRVGGAGNIGGQRRGPPQNRRVGGAVGGGRGGGRSQRGGGGPAPTAEELDAELDAYVNDMK